MGPGQVAQLVGTLSQNDEVADPGQGTHKNQPMNA